LNLRLHPRTKILFRRFKVIYDRVCVSIPLEVLLVPTWSFGVRFGADPADISVNVIEPNPRPPQLRRVSKRPFFYEVADPDHQVFERDGHGMTVTRPLGVERECYDEVEVPEDLSHVLDVVNTFGKRQLVVGTQFTHNLVTQNFDTHSFVRQLWVAGKYVSTKQDVLDDGMIYQLHANNDGWVLRLDKEFRKEWHLRIGQRFRNLVAYFNKNQVKLFAKVGFDKRSSSYVYTGFIERAENVFIPPELVARIRAAYVNSTSSAMQSNLRQQLVSIAADESKMKRVFPLTAPDPKLFVQTMQKVLELDAVLPGPSINLPDGLEMLPFH